MGRFLRAAAYDVDMVGVDKTEVTRALEQDLGVMMRKLRQVMAERARLVHPEVNAVSYGFLRALELKSLRSSELAEIFVLDKGAVSRLVTHLGKLGLVERFPDPDDGRAQLVRLTQFATQRLDQVADERRNAFHERISGWSLSDLKSLVESVRRYNDALG